MSLADFFKKYLISFLYYRLPHSVAPLPHELELLVLHLDRLLRLVYAGEEEGVEAHLREQGRLRGGGNFIFIQLWETDVLFFIGILVLWSVRKGRSASLFGGCRTRLENSDPKFLSPNLIFRFSSETRKRMKIK